MSGARSRRAPRGGRARWLTVLGLSVVAATTTAVVAAGLAAGSAPGADDASVRPVDRRAATSSSTASPGVRAGAAAPEAPRRVRLPSGRSVQVRPVSTTADGSLDLPGDVDVSGWWRGGSRLGDPFGSVLLAAHVDSVTEGLGPYAELLSVRPGDPVVLTSAHLRQRYVVSELRLLGKGPLSEHPWVYSASGPHRVTLVTCAGPYIRARGGYQQLAVVTATAVGGPVKRGAR